MTIQIVFLQNLNCGSGFKKQVISENTRYKMHRVLGAGVMGAGISQTAILAGYKVITRDLTDEILARAKEISSMDISG